MSLILDALNKADRERQNTEAPPGIRSVHEVREFKREKRWWLYLVFAFFAFVVLGAISWRLISSNSKPEPVVADKVVNDVDPLKKSTRIPGLPKPVLVTEEKPIPASSKPAVDELYKANETPDAPTTTTNSNQTALIPQNNIAVSSPDLVTESESPSPQKIETAVANNATPPPAPPIPTSLNDFPQIGSVGDLPWTIINTLPSLNYSQHIYRGPNSDSYVVLNDQQRREGQSLTENIRVAHILRDGIILAYKEYQFKLRALNSWVNI